MRSLDNHEVHRFQVYHIDIDLWSIMNECEYKLNVFHILPLFGSFSTNIKDVKAALYTWK